MQGCQNRAIPSHQCLSRMNRACRPQPGLLHGPRTRDVPVPLSLGLAQAATVVAGGSSLRARARAIMHAKVARVAFMRVGWNPEHAAREIRGLGSREALGPPCPLWQQHSMKMEHQRSLDCTWLSAIRACGWSRSFTVSDPIENQSFRMFQYAQFGASRTSACGGPCSSH